MSKKIDVVDCTFRLPSESAGRAGAIARECGFELGRKPEPAAEPTETQSDESEKPATTGSKAKAA